MRGEQDRTEEAAAVRRLVAAAEGNGDRYVGDMALVRAVEKFGPGILENRDGIINDGFKILKLGKVQDIPQK